MVDLSIVFLDVYQRVLKSCGHEIPLLLTVTPEFDLGPRSELHTIRITIAILKESGVTHF